jgi:hypothetical protein
MPTDVLVLDHPGPSRPMTTSLNELHRLFLPAGRSYVVFAKGQLFARQAHRATLRLEGFDAVDEASFSNLALGEPFSFVIGEADPLRFSGQATFSLAMTVTLPDDEDLFVIARLSGAVSDGKADVRNVKIIALTVDSLTINPA